MKRLLGATLILLAATNGLAQQSALRHQQHGMAQPVRQQPHAAQLAAWRHPLKSIVPIEQPEAIAPVAATLLHDAEVLQ